MSRLGGRLDVTLLGIIIPNAPWILPMPYPIRIEQHTANPTAVVRRHATQPQLSKVIPESCGIVWTIVRTQKIPGAGRHVALYLDCTFNLEIGVELSAPLAAAEERSEEGL